METKLKILMVEDRLSDADLIRREIRKSSIQFTDLLVETKENYINAIRDFQPDIILSDYSLPYFDGMRALLIREEMAPEIPFILVTGSNNEEIAVECMKAGADDYILKDNLTRLGQALKAAIEKKEIIRLKKEAEDRIRILSRAVEQNPASIIITNTAGNIEYVNPKFTRLTGYSQDEAIGKNPGILKSGNTSPEEYRRLWEIITSGGEWHGEFQNCKKNGETYFESASISPIINEKGSITHFLAVKEDITEKKKMLQDLILAKEKAEESDRLKTAFLNNISHEIRTPMNSIVGFSDVLDNPDLDVEKRKHYIDIIIQSSNQLLSIITDIISIATIEAGQEKIREKEVSLNTIFNNVNQQFHSKALGQNVTLHCYTPLPDKDAVIITDEIKLTQVLSNLVGNALKFTMKGHVGFGYQLKDSLLELYVEDTGIGIAPEMHEEIFKRFRQVEVNPNRQFGGSGLGLSISKAYVELLGSKLVLQSEPGKGSMFRFTIPYKKAGKTDQSNKPPVKGLSAEFNSSRTILVAEDEDLNFKLLVVLLSRIGLTIIRAANGLEAVEICQSDQPVDLVLMDIKMPVMDGYEATKIIKKLRPGLPVIAQTAYSTDEDKAKAFDCGCSDFISKPFMKEILISKISEHMATCP